jgi:hypothetical protein
MDLASLYARLRNIDEPRFSYANSKIGNSPTQGGRDLAAVAQTGESAEAVATAAKQAGRFASGDRVMSLEWLGDDPMPVPRWVPVTPNGWLSFTEREKEYCDCAVMKMAPKSRQPRDHDPSLLDWTNADLLYFIFRVDNEARH